MIQTKRIKFSVSTYVQEYIIIVCACSKHWHYDRDHKTQMAKCVEQMEAKITTYFIIKRTIHTMLPS